MKATFFVFVLLSLFFVVLSNENMEKIEEEKIQVARGSGKNEPTWDNPPDWVPDIEETEDKNSNQSNEEDEDENIEEDEENDGLSDEEIEEKLKKEEAEFAARIKEEMKINEMTEVTQDVFREYITRIIYSVEHPEDEKHEEGEHDPEEEEFLNLVIEGIMSQVPESFPVEKFDEYADTERYRDVVDNILKEKFGENYSEDVQRMMNESMQNGEEGMPSMEKMQEMMEQFNEGKIPDEMKGEEEDDEESDEMDEEEMRQAAEAAGMSVEELKNINKKYKEEDLNLEEEQQQTNSQKNEKVYTDDDL